MCVVFPGQVVAVQVAGIQLAACHIISSPLAWASTPAAGQVPGSLRFKLLQGVTEAAEACAVSECIAEEYSGRRSVQYTA